MHFIGQVSNEELTSYYDIGDLYFCASEHEGFCVPLVEAFFKRLPVLAYASTAVPATMDGGGVLYDTKDPISVASLMETILTNTSLREKTLESQDMALQRLLDKDFGATLLSFVRKVMASPHQQEYRVTSNFWDQLALADKLEDLRTYRPGIFRALPAQPSHLKTSLSVVSDGKP